jgi:antitoxin ParD1/3/4
MSTMNISLPDTMKAFVDQQLVERGYGTSSEYVRDLIRKEQQRLELRHLLLQGGLSEPAAEADKAWFDGLRERVRSVGRTK